jgi:hypothetical protein
MITATRPTLQLRPYQEEAIEEAQSANNSWATASSEAAKVGGKRVVLQPLCGEGRVLHVAEALQDALLTAEAGVGLAKAQRRLEELGG